ncbi:ATP-dependent Clp protease adapter ClpS [Maridesulfovibrio ferrireducens]|uniref:ATP-dependent Clp protease adapter protein ClpS n=1 Tax=Maridesulfovibrio ferrireducens TaxID=246191 RepID=A0A1G9LKL2_9BACT|nr:ATP-dependent Clp protease adapter ClpS [Maridesulfovibrio ferrireducens]MBI9110173.1 ATP-dependent Clp protease adapter ClpS [Maridesulfovibrio ferrireducens]SDL62502.1 ATP-dependent Clp protease adaptor protein ClpS [Maridesulfovibrio ferrireducens]
MSKYNEEFDSDVIFKDELKEPRKYKVLLHNDDYTSMEFVIAVLIQVFRKTEEESTEIMLKVHNEGFGICGIYTAEVAETRVEMVRQLATQAGFPLKCTIEEV